MALWGRGLQEGTRGASIVGAGLVLSVAGSSPTEAAPLADRPHGNVMGDGLRGLVSPPDPTAGQVCAGPETLQGIDVSYYQGNIDWNAVAADGITFAWVRVSHSTQFFDPQFDANLAGARAAGIHTGVYQYFEPQEDPIAQAQFLLDHMGPLQPGDMPPMIDVESSDTVAPGPYADAIRAWLDHVEAATGVPPIIYTGYYYWNDNVGTDEFIDHPLWIANYNPGCPLIPDYWDTWTFHQYCACESIAGIAGAVDGDTFNGNLDDLMGLSVGSGVCGDGSCTFGEDPYECPADCPPCGVIGPDGGTIDDGDACMELHGPLEYWREEAAGQGGSLRWTHATDFDAPSNYAIWRLYFEESGLYSVEVHIQQPYGETQNAAYRIDHAGGQTVEMVDQSAEAGWVSLGDLMFEAGTDHSVRIDDDTGESVDLEVMIVADALRVTRLDGGSVDDTAGETGLDPDGGTSSGVGDEDGLPGGTGSTGGGGSDTFASPGQNDDGGGCGCRSHGGTSGWAWSLLLGIAAVRRRRTRRFG
ncbi:GH25 family lysozyme [Paraliomyxa miuraensis]|uniref:GH25 family lysozyme n=1 Tax=Paraliomyxa miuraensis TaxID=376150 RepID=UPI002252A18A|nr:GH25 family lysozyme [Paraliomyxa miuraensis]MCX4246540.1 GH25 family lysozyme [Paraliomyxa miuraensis]